MSKPHYDPNSFGFLVTDIARLYRAELDRRIAAAGLKLTPAEARTLVHVARNEPVRQTVLAERMGIEAMTLSGHLDRLENHGMVERITDPEDRRAKQVRLTPAAEPVLADVIRISRETREVAACTLPEVEWKRLNALLIDMRDNLTATLRNTPT